MEFSAKHEILGNYRQLFLRRLFWESRRFPMVAAQAFLSLLTQLFEQSNTHDK